MTSGNPDLKPQGKASLATIKERKATLAPEMVATLPEAATIPSLEFGVVLVGFAVHECRVWGLGVGV